MAARNRRGFAICVGLVSCIVTVTVVTWLSNMIAAQHAISVSSGAAQQGQQRASHAIREGITVRVTEAEDKSRRSSRGAALGGSRLQEEPGRSRKDGTALIPQKGSQADLNEKCRPLPHTDYWGDALVWGSTHKKNSARECCEACSAFEPLDAEQPGCNVWVYCGDAAACGQQYRECWLKHLAHPGASHPKSGPEIPWTSGVFGLPLQQDEEAYTKDTGEDRSFHVVVTAQGPATHWQARVHYYWYKKIQRQCQEKGRCDMGGWTRLLHSGEPDELMDEIPTHVVKPLQDKDNKGYVVLNRPWAFVQWLREVTVPEEYIFMSEPDHLWLKPMPNLMLGSQPAAFPFFYIEPAKADYVHLTEKFTGKLSRRQIEQISPIGNAPTMLTASDLRKMATTWMNVSHAIFDDPEANKAWGWVLEMYGFTISCFKAGLPPATLHLKMMAQPPWDNDVPFKPSFYILHYTYGMDYSKDGVFTPGKVGEWRFDKRVYSSLPPPRNLGEPPPGMENTLVRYMIRAINEATAAIPGWDDYAKTGRATQFWDGRV